MGAVSDDGKAKEEGEQALAAAAGWSGAAASACSAEHRQAHSKSTSSAIWLHNLGFRDPAGLRELIEGADVENRVLQTGHPFQKKLRSRANRATRCG